MQYFVTLYVMLNMMLMMMMRRRRRIWVSAYVLIFQPDFTLSLDYNTDKLSSFSTLRVYVSRFKSTPKWSQSVRELVGWTYLHSALQ